MPLYQSVSIQSVQLSSADKGSSADSEVAIRLRTRGAVGTSIRSHQCRVAGSKRGSNRGRAAAQLSQRNRQKIYRTGSNKLGVSKSGGLLEENSRADAEAS